MQKKIFICCNGCNRRMLDALRLRNYFELNDCKIVRKPRNADYIIFVTCAFIKDREKECFRIIRKLNKYKGELIITGCLPEIAKTKLKQVFKGKAIATKNLDKIDKFFKKFKVKFSKVPDTHFPFFPFSSLFMILVTQVRFSKKFYRDFFTLTSNKVLNIIRAKLSPEKHKYYLRISYGCLGNCAYCSIRKAIGKLKSKPLNICLEEYREALNKGYRRFILLADDIGSYGLDINITFPTLLNKLSNFDKNINTTWEIKELHPRWMIKYKLDLIKILKTQKVQHILCGIQSGSNRILNLMNRYENNNDVITTLKEFRRINPDLKLSAQIIIGFPSETENDFQKTLDLVKKVRFNKVNLYPYSDREGTAAFKLNNKIKNSIIKKRLKIARNFLKRERIKYNFENP